MSTTLKISYLRLLHKMGRESLVARSVFGYPYRISLGDTFSENPFYNDHSNVGEVLATAAWVLGKSKPVVFDVGAHCGFIASQLAHILKKNNPEIYAFEPVAPTFSDLVHTVSELSLHEFIHPVPVAISSVPGFVKLNYSRRNSMLAQVVPENTESNNRAGEELYLAPAQTLDGVFASIGQPDVIKVDVEGWEVHVFKGAKKMMDCVQSIDTGICIEWNPEALQDTGFTARDLYGFFEGHDFYYINDYHGQEYPELQRVQDPQSLTKVCNLFLVDKKCPYVDQWKSNFLKLKTSYGVKVC